MAGGSCHYSRMTLRPLADLDADLRQVLSQRLRVRWTHTSTALEGNTLSEGETLGVLEYGLTIAGKPLAHHNEVLGHSRAMDLLDQMIGRALAPADLFALHQAVQTAVVVDAFQPVGAWKVEPNSTLAKQGGKTVINDTYAFPADVPELMNAWLAELNQRCLADSADGFEDYVWAHATFVRIHPFADGNGRMARLLANLPLLNRGQMPLLIPAEQRLAYIEALATWQLACGPMKRGQPLMVQEEKLQPFQALCVEAQAAAQAMLDEVLQLQQKRRLS
ncbi:hypothetical protein GCM10023213_05060 [Prosthecobacter algae]|uniref:Fido domain-containing protein n=2 Tax=Prosthecobacter algae TaxID=1144682 RepID=A0ABP9NXH3_9BACT